MVRRKRSKCKNMMSEIVSEIVRQLRSVYLASQSKTVAFPVENLDLNSKIICLNELSFVRVVPDEVKSTRGLDQKSAQAWNINDNNHVNSAHDYTLINTKKLENQ